jgi:hypothetical protein
LNRWLFLWTTLALRHNYAGFTSSSRWLYPVVKRLYSVVPLALRRYQADAAIFSSATQNAALTGLAYALSNTSRTLEANVLRVKGLDKKSISAVSTPWRTTSLSM